MLPAIKDPKKYLGRGVFCIDSKTMEVKKVRIRSFQVEYDVNQDTYRVLKFRCVHRLEQFFSKEYDPFRLYLTKKEAKQALYEYCQAMLIKVETQHKVLMSKIDSCQKDRENLEATLYRMHQVLKTNKN